MNDRIDVLDHGFVRIVDHMGSDLSIEHAQWEIRQYAEAMLALIRPIVPVAVAAWEVGR